MKFELKAINRNDTSVQLASSEEYRSAVKTLRENKKEFHSFQLREEKPFRVVIRNIHHSTPIDLIKSDIESQGPFSVRSVTNVLHTQTKQPLPLFFVDLEKSSSNVDIFNIHHVAYFKVRVEEPHRKEAIPQCHRCQEFGHTKAYCSHKARCVKCAGDHLTMDCTRPRKQPAKCANCGEPHPASYRGCLVHKQLQERQNLRGPHRDEQRAVTAATSVGPDMSAESRPPLPGRPAQTPAQVQQVSYANATANRRPSIKPPTHIPPPPTANDLTSILDIFVEKIKSLLDPIIRLISSLATILPVPRQP